MKVVHFQRRPAPGQVSIERLFSHVRNALPPAIDWRLHTSPHFSRGLLPRAANLLAAARDQGDVNHITGDVHYLALGLNGRRTVLTIHDCVSLVRLKGWRRTILRWIWYELPIRRCRVVTVISEATRQELLRYVRCDPSKVRVIPNCVGPEFVPFPKPFSEDKPVVLQVGTGENKNLARVAAALDGIRCNLRIIGKLNDTQRQFLAEHRIEYWNTERATDEQLVQAYRGCDLLVFASTYEGFGLPILEANAAGRPVITSNLLSMPEVAGDAALFVDPLNVTSIREAVTRLTSDVGLRQRLVAEGFKNVRRFAASSIAAQYAALYEEVADHA